MLALLVALAPLAGEARELWEARCQACHGSDGSGDTKEGKKTRAADLRDPKLQKAMSDSEMENVIREGTPMEAGEKRMPAFKNKLTDEQIKLLVQFVRSLTRP